jgi:hypothetical protein
MTATCRIRFDDRVAAAIEISEKEQVRSASEVEEL